MAKFFNSDYEEVEAFTQEELDAKLKEATEAAKKEAGSTAAELEKKVAELEAAKTKAEEKLTKRSEEYNNLKAKYEETGEKVKGAEGERKAAYEKMRDQMITKLAGDDKEYEEQLRAQYERFGKETLDATELEKSMKDAHTLALSELNREFTPFSLADNSGARPPEKKADGDNTVFTETDEGKATLDTALYAMGMKPSSTSDKKSE